jgi:hypothetical protein
MAHSCKYIQPGRDSCPEHLLGRDGIRYRFRKQMEDVLTYEEINTWHELMLATMLPSDKIMPLDDRPASYITQIAEGGVSS